MKYLVILIIASVFSTAGGYIDMSTHEIPVENIEFIDPIYITVESVTK